MTTVSFGSVAIIPAFRNGALAFNPPAARRRKYNQLSCDGHVVAMDPNVLFNPRNTSPIRNYDHPPHSESPSNVGLKV